MRNNGKGATLSQNEREIIMSVLGNVLWFIFGGFIMGTAWVLAGCLIFIFSFGLLTPLAIACMRIALFAYLPFGKTLVAAEDIGEKRIPGTMLANLIWIIFFGFWISIGHILCAIVEGISIIGIPFAWAHLKLAAAGFSPLGKRIVSCHMANEINRRKAGRALDEKLCG